MCSEVKAKCNREIQQDNFSYTNLTEVNCRLKTAYAPHRKKLGYYEGIIHYMWYNSIVYT
jgi:hypothetical protein